MLISPGSAQFFIHHNGQTDPLSNSPDLSSVTSSSSPPTLETDPNLLDKPEYLAQLMKDKRQLAAVPNMFLHIERLLDHEIRKVRNSLFNLLPRPTLELPEASGEKRIFHEKVFIPVQEYPEYNFVGRILGPRGLTAKQLESETGCKVMVRGRGSMRDKNKEDQYRGKPNWEHLDEELHVLLQCEDTENRALIKLERAKDEINKLLQPTTEGEDQLKKKQLTELAIINGTYRDPNLVAKRIQFQNSHMPLGAPLILTPQLQQALLATQTPTLYQTNQHQSIPSGSIMQNTDGNFLQLFTPLQTIDHMGGMLANGTHLIEYPNQTAFPFLTTTTPTGVANRPTTNNASGNITPAATGPSVSARFHPYKIQSPRLNRS